MKMIFCQILEVLLVWIIIELRDTNSHNRIILLNKLGRTVQLTHHQLKVKLRAKLFEECNEIKEAKVNWSRRRFKLIKKS